VSSLRLIPEPSATTLSGNHSPLGPVSILGNPTHAVQARLLNGWPAHPTGEPLRIAIDIGEVLPGTLVLGADESYNLRIDATGVTLAAATNIGARRGAETLLQLAHDPDSAGELPHVLVHDTPAFGWRGLLIDPCRHWLGVEAILDTLDAMAAAKFNVLHLHLSDDQAFRLESRRWPDLHRLGADGKYFTRDDISRIVDHASDAGIRVVPELDMPGHVTSWLVGYPHLAATPGPFELRTTLGIATVALDPESAIVAEFIEQLLAEVAELFPDRYIHIGGDEVAPEAWPTHDVAVIQRQFTQRVTDLVLSLGRTPIVWDEAWHPDLSTEVVTQVWRGHRRLRSAAAALQPVIFSTPYYLDLGYDPTHHHVNPLVDAAGWAEHRQRLHSDPRLGAWGPIAAAFDNDAHSNDADDNEAAPDVVDPSAVLGGEACMWSELVTEQNLALRLWPTGAAVADVLWSGTTAVDPTLGQRLSRFADFLAASTSTDVEALRTARWLELAGGDPVVAEAVAVLAGCCEPTKWYSRHALLPGGRLDQPFDGFVDALGPVALTPNATDPTPWRAAADLILATDTPASIQQLWPIAEELLAVCDGHPTDLGEAQGEVLVTARLARSE